MKSILALLIVLMPVLSVYAQDANEPPETTPTYSFGRYTLAEESTPFGLMLPFGAAGEHLFALNGTAAENGAALRDIIRLPGSALNALQSAGALQIDHRAYLTYIARQGDTMPLLALRMGIPLNHLLALNPQIDSSTLLAGQVIVIAEAPADPLAISSAADSSIPTADIPVLVEPTYELAGGL